MAARSATRLRPLCLNVSHFTPRRAFATQAASAASGSPSENAVEVSKPAKPTQWTRLHAPGEVPLYDMALKIIEEDSARHKAEIARLQAFSEEHPQNEQLRRDIEKIEILSEVNVPEVRWKFENGYGDMSKHIYRYFEEKRWREKGRLDLLMQRLFTMHVIPDLLAMIHPSLDIDVTFTNGKRPHKDASHVEPGVYLTPETTLYPPWLRVTTFHPETRFYTLVMVDPDVPDPANISYKQFLHWVVPNIPLSALQSGKNIPLPENHPAPWIPPHPTNGTKYHRYVIFLFQNPDPNKPLEIPGYSMEQRKVFSLRKFISEYGFQPEKAGGAHMWRELWSTAVSDIHREILKIPEPRYGKLPRPDRYAEMQKRRRYI